jgi:hypothetical protein
MLRPRFSIVLALLLAAVSTAIATVVTAAPSSQIQKSLDPRYLADDLPRLPMGVERGVRPPTMIKAAYEWAARHPEVANYIPCFCGCEQAGHKGNHDCFVSGRDAKGAVKSWEPHGLVCEVCIDVAYESFRMHNSGASVTAIRAAIEKKYTGARFHTPTPMPKRGGGHGARH